MRHELKSGVKKACINCGKRGKPRHAFFFFHEFNPIYMCPTCFRRVARHLAKLARIGE